MAGRRRRKEENVYSFRTFLKTGELGPLQPAMAMMDVARLFGPPISWLSADGIVIPCYWCYDHLEISFGYYAPHAIDYFQLEWAYLLKGDGRFLGDNMRLDLDGIDVDMPLSRMLRQRLWPLGDVAVSVDVNLRQLEILHGTIAMIYSIDAPPDELDDLDDRLLAAAFDRGDLAVVVAWCERYAKIDSIYSTPARGAARHCRYPQRYSCVMTGRRFLDLLAAKKRKRSRRGGGEQLGDEASR